MLRPGIRIEKLDFTINSVISSDTGQGNDAPRTERALCFRPNEPKNKKEPERVPGGGVVKGHSAAFSPWAFCILVGVAGLGAPKGGMVADNRTQGT